MQLFLNFISNALKFTQNGGEITVKLEANEHMIVESKKNYNRIRKNTLHEFKALSPAEVFEAVKDVRLKQDRSKSFQPKIMDEAQFGQERFIGINIKICDTGCGISSEGLSKLFINFGKLDENS